MCAVYAIPSCDYDQSRRGIRTARNARVSYPCFSRLNLHDKSEIDQDVLPMTSEKQIESALSGMSYDVMMAEKG